MAVNLNIDEVISMKADNIKLLEFIGQSKRTFSIPVYQRNYDWKKDQCIRLFRDIEKLAESRNNVTHFLGTIVYVYGKIDAIFSEFIVIDGQQRLTSTMLLLKALHTCSENKDIKHEIYEEFLINRRAPERYRMKLKPIETDHDDYINLIEGEIIKSSSNIIGNYNLFVQLIKSSKYTTEKLLYAMHKLEIVYIQLESGRENPQLIFESLNSTGLNLTQADLIRNFLLMGQDYDRQENLYKKYWLKIEKLLPNSIISDFVRDYLTLKRFNIPKKDKVYEVFKEHFVNLENYDAEGVLEELLEYAKYYSWFYYQNSPNDVVNEKLSEIQRLKSTVTYPFLLNVFEDTYYYNKISLEELISILDLVISYIFRRLICEMPTNALNKVFARLHKDVENSFNKELNCYENVALVLLQKKSSSLFPKDEHFKQSFLTKDLYNFKLNKYILEKLESYNIKEVVNFDSSTIEHIMPQRLSPKWQVDLGKNYEKIHTKYLHCIGNLTLSGYNRELSNRSFEEKKKILMNSNISLNRELKEFERWTESEITSRGEKLFEKAKRIWALPEINYKLIEIDENEMRNEFEIMEDVNVTGREPFELIFIGEKTTISSWKEFFTTICHKTYEYDSEMFRSLVNHKDFIGRNRKIISNDSSEMRKPYQLTDNIFIEQHFNANDALNYSKLIIEKFEGLETEVSYKIR